MKTVFSYPHAHKAFAFGPGFNSWPTTAKPIHKQGRPGKKPRPVTCVRVKPSR